jgi:hypothetical protein
MAFEGLSGVTRLDHWSLMDMSAFVSRAEFVGINTASILGLGIYLTNYFDMHASLDPQTVMRRRSAGVT